MKIDPTWLLRLFALRRQRILARLDPVRSQEQTLLRLVRRAAGTTFGIDHDFAAIRSVDDFRKRVPLRGYDSFWLNYWKDRFPRLDDVSWPGRIPFFAVSSGTSTGRTKYIPLTHAMLRSNTKAGLDLLAYHLAARPQSQVLQGKSFMLGGSTELVEKAPGVFCGDLSGIVTKALPFWARTFAFPDQELALLSDWERKLERLAWRSIEEDIRILAGVPSWMLILLERVRQLRGPNRLPYPDLEMLVHGGVNFEPYRKRFSDLLAGSNAEMREVYPASEGFIASADRGYGEGLRLNLDHGLFFEFVPLEELEADNPTRHWIAEVERDTNYAVVMSTCAGLWSYIVGDTVRFVDLSPPRILITGRTSYAMSAFGEHLIGEEIEGAVSKAAEELAADLTDFAMGAVHPEGDSVTGHHRYFVEFATALEPSAAARMAHRIDAELARMNEDYEAHRAEGFGMGSPEVILVPPGTFAAWMKARGRLGGQNKVPRVINDPDLLDDLDRFCRARI